jgi:hypothetical protein
MIYFLVWAVGLSITFNFTSKAQAKIFRNAYISFEMPDVWKCQLEHTEWVCRSEKEKDSKEAIIILTAKEVGPTDSFEQYTQYLSNPLQTSYKSPGASISKVVYPPKKVQINDQPWIDGLHQGSEITTYFTRYLATIKDRIAILVTFSAHKNHYTKYSSDFFKAVQSLRVIASKNILANPQQGPIRPGSETLGAPIGAAMAGLEVVEPGDGEGDGEGSGKTKALFIGLALLLAGVGVYIFLKNRQG